MAIVLYDLTGVEERCFSPYCWRIRLALEHKGLDYTRKLVRFTEIKDICGGGYKTVPVIEDGDKVVVNSFDIALYLDQAYPDTPSLFGGDITLARFIEHWTLRVAQAGMAPLVVCDVYDHLTPEDQPYFRESREARFGKPLEEVRAGRDDLLDAFRARLAPLRATVAASPYLGGDSPNFADYMAMGPFQWGRVISPYRVLEKRRPGRPVVRALPGPL